MRWVIHVIIKATVNRLTVQLWKIIDHIECGGILLLQEQQAEGSDRGDKGEGDGKDGGQETE